MTQTEQAIFELRYMTLMNFFIMVALIGAMLNTFTLTVNDGRMPVKSDSYFSEDMHFSYQDKDDVNYHYLTDVIPLFSARFSAGDVLLIIGVFGNISFLVKLLKLRRKK